MLSVRTRLTLVLALGFAALVVASGLFVGRLVREHVTDEHDRTLAVKAQAFRALTEQEQGRIELDYRSETMPEYERAQQPEHFQFWLDDGTPLLRSKRLTADLPRQAGLDAGPRFQDLTLPDGRPGRCVQIAYLPHDAGTPSEAGEAPDAEVIAVTPGRRAVVLVVARDRLALDSLLGRVRTALFAVGAVALLLALLLVWRALAAGLRPIERIVGEVASLDIDRLSARVSFERSPRELAGMVTQLNALLARLEESVERERRFTGNVAHELRTPIAELRALAAVGARWPDDAASVEQFFQDVEIIAGRMEGLVADLFLLARCQAGAERVVREPLPLMELLAPVSARLALQAQRRGLEMAVDVPEGLVVSSDRGKLSILLTNLVGNAVSHARPAGAVRVSARREGSRVAIEVSNDAELLTADDMLHLTEPFWRKDPARSPGAHSGLGLALVQALADLLGLSVRFEQGPDSRFVARVEVETASPAMAARMPLSRS